MSPTEAEWLEGLIELASQANLNDFEQRFLDDQANRFREYGADTRMSPKQFNILYGIAEDCGYPLPSGAVYDRPAWKR